MVTSGAAPGVGPQPGTGLGDVPGPQPCSDEAPLPHTAPSDAEVPSTSQPPEAEVPALADTRPLSWPALVTRATSPVPEASPAPSSICTEAPSEARAPDSLASSTRDQPAKRSTVRLKKLGPAPKLSIMNNDGKPVMDLQTQKGLTQQPKAAGKKAKAGAKKRSVRAAGTSSNPKPGPAPADVASDGAPGLARSPSPRARRHGHEYGPAGLAETPSPRARLRCSRGSEAPQQAEVDQGYLVVAEVDTTDLTVIFGDVRPSTPEALLPAERAAYNAIFRQAMMLSRDGKPARRLDAEIAEDPLSDDPPSPLGLAVCVSPAPFGTLTPWPPPLLTAINEVERGKVCTEKGREYVRQ